MPCRRNSRRSCSCISPPGCARGRGSFRRPGRPYDGGAKARRPALGLRQALPLWIGKSSQGGARVQSRAVMLTFPLRTSPGQDSLNPKGIPSSSPRVARNELPWEKPCQSTNPERVAAGAHPIGRVPHRLAATLSGLSTAMGDPTQGSSPTRNPGLNDAIPLGLAEIPPGLVGNRKDAHRSPRACGCRTLEPIFLYQRR